MSTAADSSNRVPQLQRQFQASGKPIYVRGARGGLYFNTYLAFFSVGALGAAYGITSLIRGKK